MSEPLVAFSKDSVSVKISHSVVSDSLQPHGLQHARTPCPSPTPGAYANSCPIKSAMPSNHLILCRPLLLPPSGFPSIRVFSLCTSVNSKLLLLPYHWVALVPARQFSWSICFVFTAWKLAHPALHSRLLFNLFLSELQGWHKCFQKHDTVCKALYSYMYCFCDLLHISVHKYQSVSSYLCDFIGEGNGNSL